MRGFDVARPEHELFTAWAKERGVWINGVGPAKLPGRGLGIVALQHIKGGDELVRVPVSALFTVESIPRRFKKLHRNISVHGLLASFLAFGDTNDTTSYGAWRATWPSPAEFKASMPILWPEYMRSRISIERVPSRGFFPLPPAIGGNWEGLSPLPTRSDYVLGLLGQQEVKLKKDWAIVSRALANADYDDFVYHWLIVNTRSFYYELPSIKEPQSRDDCMVLCPFADYFNHADHGCDVSFNEKGFTVTSDREYATGEEIYVSYGSHSNDFLLTEYGFILEENKWDSLPLDDLIPSLLHGMARKRLEDTGYLGYYTLSRDGVCHRTQVAVRTQTLSNRDWKKFVEGKEAEMDEERDESKANAYVCQNILDAYYSEATNALECFEEEEFRDYALPKTISTTLTQRWTQIRSMIRDALKNDIDALTRQALGHRIDIERSDADDQANESPT